MAELSERDRRKLARDRLRDMEDLTRQVEELRQLRERDRQITIAQESAIGSGVARRESEQLTGAHGGASNKGLQVQGGGQQGAESTITQEERLSELDSRYSLISDKGYEAAYPSSIESSLRRMNIDKVSSGIQVKSLSEASFLAEQSSQQGSKHSKARKKSVSGNESESSSMYSVVSHEVRHLAGAHGGASAREAQEQGLSERGSRYSVMRGMEKQLTYPCSTRSINADKAGSQRKSDYGASSMVKKSSSETKQKLVSRYETERPSRMGRTQSKYGYEMDRGSLAMRGSMNATYDMYPGYSKQPQSLIEEDRQYAEQVKDFSNEEERALRYRIERILSEDRTLEEEREKRIRAEEQLHERLANLQIMQEKLKVENEKQMQIEAMKSDEQRLNRKLLDKIKMDREREQRILAMHRQAQILEEEIKRDRQRQELPSNRYDPHINIKAERNDNRQQIVDAEQIERNNYQQEYQDQREGQLEEEEQIENLENRQNHLRFQVKSKEEERINMLESKQKQLLQKVKSQAEELERKRNEMERLEIEINNRRVTDVRINNERDNDEAEIVKLEEERRQLILQQKELQDNEQKKEDQYQITHDRNQKEDELIRKEEYLKQFEQDLLKKEEEMTARIREGAAVRPSPEIIAGNRKKADTLHFVKPYITPFSGIDPVPKNESSFEDWRVEIRSLIESGEFSDYEVAQLIRNSLKLPAKKAVFTLGSSATSKDIIEKLQNVFGNVASGESVLTEFYTSAQKSDESVTMWGMRLEEIVQRGIEKGQIELEKRDEMLRTRFWRYLYNKELQNATVVYFDQIKNFDQLRSKVRSEEYWKSTSVSDGSANKVSNRKPEGVGATAPVQHQPLNVDPNTKYLREISKRLETLEEDLKFRKNRRQRMWNKGQNQPQEGQKDKTVPKANDKARTEEKPKNPLNK